MDIYSEQLARKEKNAAYVLKKVGVLAGTFIIAMAFLFLILIYARLLATLGFLGAFGIFYLGIYFSNNLSIEYEYIVTGTCLDIDKIMAAKRRKRLISVDIPSFEQFAKYTEQSDIPDCDVTIEAIYSRSAPLYYAVFDNDKYGKVLLLFNPDDNTLDTIDTSLPRSLKIF